MPFDSEPYWDGTWRDVNTGVDVATMDNFTVGFDQPGIPKDGPVDTRLEGPWGMPYWDGLEDPTNFLTDIPLTADPLPWSPSEGTAGGNAPKLGAYEGAYRTRGGVQAWGHEASGGMWGDQFLGRIMRFPANIPERWDPYGVFNTDPRDDLAAAMANQDLQYRTDAAVTSSLLEWPNLWGS